MQSEPRHQEKWEKRLMEGETVPRYARRVFGILPSNPRCKLCNAPFKGWGGFLMHLMGREQSRYNPRYCESCERLDEPGGAEVELTMLFADVRGSTRLAEQMSALEFTKLMHRFYGAATDVLVSSDALVDRFVGDEVIGLYIPGFAGRDHARHAVRAAQRLLTVTGHVDAKGPWVPVGVGVHTGPAFVGVVGGDDGRPRDLTALGDNVNVTARLASAAGTGEVLISEAAYESAGLDLGELERRELELKGKRETTAVRVLRVAPN